MLKFAANLSTLFTEVPLQERFSLAAKAGFSAVEVQFPYALSPEQIKAKLHQCELSLVLINLPAGDWANGDRGIACDPERVEEFRAGVEQCLRYAAALGVQQVNCLAGIPAAHISHETAQATLISNLQYAADYLAPHNITLLIEAINTQDVPGFFLKHTQQAADIIAMADRKNLKIQYDVYHMQIMEGNLTHTVKTYLPLIHHIQVADVPGRHEPGTGEIHFHNLFAAFAKLGYKRYISFEYFPQQDTQSGLKRLEDWLE